MWVLAMAMAAGFQDLDALEARLVAGLGAAIGAPGGPAAPIDRRLKLLACPSDVTIDPPAAGAVALRCQPVGWRLRVPLMRDGAGGAATSAATRVAAVVRRGDPVELRAGSAGFTVSSQVVAQEDGAPGARIRVKGDGTSTPLIAEVVEAGVVRIPGFK